MSCCGACGGQDLENEKEKQKEVKQEQEKNQKPASENAESSVKNWDGGK